MTDLNDEAQETGFENTAETLDSIFEDEDTEETESKEVEQEPEPKDDKTDGEDIKGAKDDKNVSKDADETSDDDSAPPADKEEKSVPIEALHDTRRKLKDANDRAEVAEAKLAKIEEKDVPDPKDDPDGYKTHMEASAVKSRITISRELMADNVEDYGDKEAHFIEMTKTDPSLVSKMQESANPAKFAYETANENIEIAKLKDPAYRDNLKAELRKEIEAENEGDKSGSTKTSKADERKAAATSVPNLTNTASKGNNSVHVEKDEDLDGMFEDQSY